MNRYTRSSRVLSLFAIPVLLAAQAAGADTLAYWRFEGDGVTAPNVGDQVEDTNGRVTTTTGVGLRVQDVSGNGNTLWAWDHPFAGYTYQANVPASVVNATGAANNFSVQNAGNFPALMTWSRESLPTRDIETVKPLAWTIEASIRPTTVGGTFRTFVGRDGNSIATDGNLAPLYFQTTPQGVMRINYTDEAGVNHVLDDTTGALAANTWYNVAAVSDGTNLKLFKDAGFGYEQVGTLDLTASGSTDLRLGYDDNGSNTAGDTQWGWTLGRGRYGGGDGQGQHHGDRWFGNIDEVRISDSALSLEQLLFYRVVVPTEPRDLVWVGADNGNAWDTDVTQNFTVGGTPTTFKARDRITFDDSGSPHVLIVGNNVTSGMTVNGSVEKTWDGDGTISGTGKLVKNGSGKLIVANTGGNTFAGGVDLNAGSIELAGTGTSATPLLGNGPLVNNGTLISNRAATVFIPNAISGPGNIIARQFTVLSGNNTFTGTVTVEANTLFLDSATALGTADGGTTVNFGAGLGVFLGNFNFGTEALSLAGNRGDGEGAIRVGGNRTVTFGGPITFTDFVGLRVDGGSTLNFTGTVSGAGRDLYLNGTGVLAMAATNLAQVNINEGTLRQTGGAGKIQGLNIAEAGRVDMTTSAIAVDYDGGSPYEALLAQIVDGVHITTSAGTNYAVGIIENADPASRQTTFAGMNVDESTVLLRGTFKGDTNLSGNVNFDDLLALAQNYDAAGSGKKWSNGDSNYDGIVNFDDLLALAQNYGLGAADVAALTAVAGADFVADWALAQSLVPEPATLSLLGMGGLLAARRRRPVSRN